MLPGDPARLRAGSVLPRPCTPSGPRPCKRCLPPCPPSSPSLNSPTASIDVLPASPSPAQPDSTWERQVKAAGPWEGSSCAPPSRGAAGEGQPPSPPPERDPAPGAAAGSCFQARPAGNQRGLGEDEAFSRLPQGLHGTVSILLPGPCLRPPDPSQKGTGSSVGQGTAFAFALQAPRARSQAGARLACFFPAAGPPASPCAFTSGLCLCPNYGAAQLAPGGRNGVCTQGKCQSSARAWDAASFARAQVRGTVTFTRAQVPSPKPTRGFCSGILPDSRSTAGHPLGRECRSGWRTPRHPAAQPCFLTVSTLQHGGLFLSLSFYLLCRSRVHLGKAVVFAL